MHAIAHLLAVHGGEGYIAVTPGSAPAPAPAMVTAVPGAKPGGGQARDARYSGGSSGAGGGSSACPHADDALVMRTCTTRTLTTRSGQSKLHSNYAHGREPARGPAERPKLRAV
jgi:hypothetical protein